MINLGVNFRDNYKQLIPVKIRGIKIVSLLYSMLTGLQQINDLFKEFGSSSRYTLSFNGQQMYLERILNDRFDPNQRGVYIADPAIAAQELAIMWYDIENGTDFTSYYASENVNKPILFYESEYSQIPHFIVFVRNSILTQDLIIRATALINYYKLAGKHFEIRGY